MTCNVSLPVNEWESYPGSWRLGRRNAIKAWCTTKIRWRPEDWSCLTSSQHYLKELQSIWDLREEESNASKLWNPEQVEWEECHSNEHPCPQDVLVVLTKLWQPFVLLWLALRCPRWVESLASSALPTSPNSLPKFNEKKSPYKWGRWYFRRAVRLRELYYMLACLFIHSFQHIFTGDFLRSGIWGNAVNNLFSNLSPVPRKLSTILPPQDSKPPKTFQRLQTSPHSPFSSLTKPPTLLHCLPPTSVSVTLWLMLYSS